MRKQTKIAAVVSAAALLALGASMTSFAASKGTWMMVDGEWYCYDKNGDAYENTFCSSNGKEYYVGDDGQLVRSAWVDGDDGDKYFVNSSGAKITNDWRLTTPYDDDTADEEWYYFKSNGKKRFNESDFKDILEKKINGKHYRFDNRGVMVYTWGLASGTEASASSAANWQYFNSPEDGARVTKGWFKVVAPMTDGTDNTFKNYGDATFAKTNADDESEKWYYADGDGELYVGAIKKIKGKYYGFRPDDGEKGAAMLTGLCILQVDNNGNIQKVIDDDIGADDVDDILDGKYDGQDSWAADGVSLYYFGNNEDSDGALKTGSTTISLDGSSYNFYFSKTGGTEGKGKGVSGIDDKKYIYMFGCKVKADADDKYQLVKVTANTKGSKDINADGVSVEKVEAADFRGDAITGTYTNTDNESVSYTQLDDADLYLVNTAGNVQKNKTAAKDGNDWYFYVSNYNAKLYTNNKSLKAKDGSVTDWKGLVK